MMKMELWFDFMQLLPPNERVRRQIRMKNANFHSAIFISFLYHCFWTQGIVYMYLGIWRTFAYDHQVL